MPRRRLAVLSAAFACLTLAAFVSDARAGGPDSPPVVIELYTSQGCSSCPPADALLRRLAAEPGVIALSLHVDYWDYLGWPDPFSDPRHTARQRAYARHAGAMSVYTPQIVVQGTAHLAGADEVAVRAAVAAARQGGPGTGLTLGRHGGTVRIAAEPMARPAAAHIHVIEVIPHTLTPVTRGENAGRVLEQRNVVTDWRAVGSWDGVARWEMTVPAAPDRDIVVLVQEEGPGVVLAAARLR
jgi:hypothetical protein